MMRRLWVILALAAAIGLGAGQSLAAERVALLIGNGAYQSTATLRNPPNDVAAMAASLKALAFDVAVVSNADRLAMARAVRDFGRRASEADTALLFYSGHGMELGGENYLIPVDAELVRPEDAGLEAIPLDSVVSATAGAKRLSIVVVDACRDSRFASVKRSGQRGFRSVRARRRQLIAFSTAPGAVAYDGAGRLSPYTQALTEALGAEAAARQDVRLLFGGLGPRVAELVEGWQEPFLHSAGFGPKTVSLGPAAAAPRRVEAAPAAPEREPGAASGAPAAQAAYEAAERAGEAAMFDVVATRFEGTVWAELAKGRAAALRSRAAAAAAPARPVDEPAAPVWRPSRADTLLAQRRLRALRLYKGGIDGDWGPGSSAALRSFQRREGLAPADGALTRESLDALAAAEPPPAAQPEETRTGLGAAPSGVPEGAARGAAPEGDAAQRAYEAAERAADPAMLDLVAGRFPGTIWAGLAERRAVALRAAGGGAPEPAAPRLSLEEAQGEWLGQCRGSGNGRNAEAEIEDGRLKIRVRVTTGDGRSALFVVRGQVNERMEVKGGLTMLGCRRGSGGAATHSKCGVGGGASGIFPERVVIASEEFLTCSFSK